MKVVLVTGGRAYKDRAHVDQVLTDDAPDLVIHGGAKTMNPGVVYNQTEFGYLGADNFAGLWCDANDVPQLKAPYMRALGKRGGPIRNTWMIELLTMFEQAGHRCSVIAFPGGSGTDDTVDKALRAGFTVTREYPR